MTENGHLLLQSHVIWTQNAGATNKQLINWMFKELIEKTMEVYIDDILVKSLKAEDHFDHLIHTFDILEKYRMRLNSTSEPLDSQQGSSSNVWLLREE